MFFRYVDANNNFSEINLILNRGLQSKDFSQNQHIFLFNTLCHLSVGVGKKSIHLYCILRFSFFFFYDFEIDFFNARINVFASFEFMRK